jgi:ABC-type dipeptide/oligopeptide/nickel transport system ATPase subunit
MKGVRLGLVFLLAGCGSLITEQRMAKLNTEVQSIQRDYSVLSATFTPEQREKCARAKTVQDQITIQEFYASLNEQQQATMTTLLDRAHQGEQERQTLCQTVQRDLAMQQAARQRLAQDFSLPPSVP